MSADSTEPGALLARHLQRVTAVAFDITDALVLILDRTGRIIRFNPTCERLSGRQEAEVQGQLLWPLVLDPVEAARAEALFRQIVPRVTPGTYENTWRTPQGDVRFIHWMASFLYDETGEIELIVCTGIDVTEERRARQALEESETLFRTLFICSADGVVLIDPREGRIVNCNPAFAQMTGYAPQDLIGQSIHQVDEPGSARLDLDWVRAQEPGTRCLTVSRHRAGHLLQIESTVSLVRVAGADLILRLDRDVTAAQVQAAALRGAVTRLSFLAAHDDLTGLLHRSAWLDRVSDVLGEAAAYAVVFLDLDDFKGINDTYGHAAGDQVLQVIAARLRAAVEPAGVAGRVGGDEFVALLPVADEAAVPGTCRDLEAAGSGAVEVPGGTVTVGVSVGASLIREADGTAQEVLRRADQDMYRVKSTPRTVD